MSFLIESTVLMVVYTRSSFSKQASKNCRVRTYFFEGCTSEVVSNNQLTISVVIAANLLGSADANELSRRLIEDIVISIKVVVYYDQGRVMRASTSIVLNPSHNIVSDRLISPHIAFRWHDDHLVLNDRVGDFGGIFTHVVD